MTGTPDNRIFAPEVMGYIDFILKAKTVGLTLSEMRRVIEVAHHGANPCPRDALLADVLLRSITGFRNQAGSLSAFAAHRTSIMHCGSCDLNICDTVSRW